MVIWTPILETLFKLLWILGVSMIIPGVFLSVITEYSLYIEYGLYIALSGISLSVIAIIASIFLPYINEENCM